MSNPSAPSVIYVDTDERHRHAVVRRLQDAGFEAREAAVGSEAVCLATERGEPPDLVLLDVDLPAAEGLEVCRRFKMHPATTNVPVLHLSGVLLAARGQGGPPEGGVGDLPARPAEPADVVATVRDLLRARRAEQEARAAADDWRAAFDALPDAFLVLDGEGVVVRCNRAAAELFRRPPEFVTGRPGRDLFRDAFGWEGASLLPAAGQAEPPAPELPLAGRWLRLSAHPFPGDSGAAGCVLRITDVTTSRASEESLRRAEHLVAVGRLAAGLAHEVNNLLTAAICNLSMALTATPEDDPRRRPLRAAEDASWRAEQLLGQLLGQSRPRRPRTGPTDLNACVREVTELLRAALGRQVELETRCPEGLWPVWADAGRVVQALLNLVLNARDAMPRGGKVFVETANDVSREAVRLRVQDTGPGVAPEVLPHLFEPFSTTKEVGAGTGLGLSVVRECAREHGGWVECHNVPGAGACFDLFLPRLGAPNAGPPGE